MMNILSVFLIVAAIAVLTFTLNAQTNAALRDELLVMRDRDQKVRDECTKGNAEEQIKCLVKTADEVDKPNTRRITEIFNSSGFPRAKEVGSDGVKAFFLILQHSGDLGLKKKCVAGIEKAFKEKILSPSEYASFIDRLLVDQGKPQIYGSNFESKDGKLVMSNTEDLKNLDQRRKKIGLPPIADYVKILRGVYKLEAVIPQP